MIPLQAVHFKVIRVVHFILIRPVHLKVIWKVHLKCRNQFTRCTASVVFGVPARNWTRRTGWRLRLGGGSEVVGIVYGEIKTSLGFCRSYYGDVVLVEARRLCYVWCRLETGRVSPATLLCVAPARNWRWKLGVLSCGVPASNGLVNA